MLYYHIILIKIGKGNMMPEIIDGDNIVVKDNKLNEIRHNLTLTEYKFIVACISLLNKDDEDFNVIELSVVNFAEMMQVDKNRLYGHMKKMIDGLASKILGVIEAETGNYTVRSWFEEISYIENTGTIRLIFNYRLKKFLLYNMIEQYTKYVLKNIVFMKCKYSIKIYEMLKQYEKIGTVSYTLKKFKYLLGIENNYKEYSVLKLRVLEPANKELFKYADIYFTYSEIKKNRQTIGVKFRISKKGEKNELLEYDRFNKLKIIKLIQEKMNLDYGETISYTILNSYHRFYLIKLHQLLYTLKPESIRKPKSLIKWHLQGITLMYDIDGIEDY
jgi:plasmid replication initiation protein